MATTAADVDPADGLIHVRFAVAPILQNPGHATTDQPPQFTAAIRCPHGATHTHTIHSALDLRSARLITQDCDRRHAEPTEHDGVELDWDKAIGPRQPAQRAVFPVPVPGENTVSKTVLALPATRRVLADQLTRTPRTTAADTQPIPRADIEAGLTARADHDHAKEHPEP